MPSKEYVLGADASADGFADDRRVLSIDQEDGGSGLLGALEVSVTAAT